ncbi:hypothetical protein QJS66_11015 [Kocuria rhizophila]|nr:hypothetical protein QJS66_11015 [Kocuria rhizophila]
MIPVVGLFVEASWWAAALPDVRTATSTPRWPVLGGGQGHGEEPPELTCALPASLTFIVGRSRTS